jgi:hypothetical protein
MSNQQAMKPGFGQSAAQKADAEEVVHGGKNNSG